MIEEPIDLSKIRSAYFIGIKGVGMTALAQVLKSRQINISGSDTEEKFFTDRVLDRLGIKVFERFDRENLPQKTDLVIVSAAYLGQDIRNPEVQEAKKRKSNILTYAQVLGALFEEKYGIAVAGTHGKSTTTAMLGEILEKADYDPTVIVGTEVLLWKSNARVGSSKYLIAEADEYRNNFLYYNPQAVVLNNLEFDHPDFFKNFKEYKKTFKELVKRVPQTGFIAANLKDKAVREIIKEAKCPIIEIDPNNIKIKLPFCGEHNLSNAAAARAAALKLGVKPEVVEKALLSFSGTRRRFEIKGEKDGVVFIDDYAHHPTEIKAALKGVKEKYPQKEIWAVFQPHTFSRTKAFLEDFGRAFKNADHVVITDIYGSAREKEAAIHALDLVKEIKKHKNDVEYISGLKEAADFLKRKTNKGDVVLSMGAGNIWRLSTLPPFSL